MIRFEVDMNSDALTTLQAIANLPITRLHRFMGRIIAHQVKTEVYPDEWSERVTKDSQWQQFKQRMPVVGRVPGFLTGSTYTAIQVISYDQYSALVGLSGKWPLQFVTMPEYAKSLEIEEDIGMAQDLQRFTTSIEQILTSEERQLLSEAGATGRAGESFIPKTTGIYGLYKRKYEEDIEYIKISQGGVFFKMYTESGYPIEKRLITEDMSIKKYGTRRTGGSIERKTSAVDFMYLRSQDVNIVMDRLSQAIDIVLRSKVKEIAVPGIIPYKK